ncbi:MAG: penicillin acylase family protein, partial [bacterium]
NSFAVSGKNRSSGKSILASDPHLDLLLPSTWYPVFLQTPEMNVRGFSIAGCPGIIIGFNDDIAWGMTNFPADVQDYYSIVINRNRGKYFYSYKDSITCLSSRLCTINVRHGRPVEEELFNSRFGPVIIMQKSRATAVKWTGHMESREMCTIYKLNKAKNYNDFISALKFFSAPPLNFTYADTRGNIAQWSVGTLPKRVNGDGRGIAPGDGYCNLWEEFIPFDSLPHVYNPQCGYVFSANQQTDTGNSIHSLIWDAGYRSRRLNEILDEKPNLSLTQAKDLQNDLLCVAAREILPILFEAAYNDTALYARTLIPILKDWDHKMCMTKKAPLVWSCFFREYRRLVWDDDLPEAANDDIGQIYPNDAVLEYITKEQPDAYWFAYSDSGETRDKIMRLALKETFYGIREQFGADTALWSWGNVHLTLINHPTRIPVLGRGPFPMPGNPHTANCSHSLGTGTFGVSFRLIVDMEDRPKAWFAFPGGISGNPASYFYDNLLSSWRNGKYYPL